MAVNDMTFEQAATVLKSLADQTTGVSNITPTDVSSFVTVGQLALKNGYDPVLNALSQLISRTIFSIRPYASKLRGMEFSEEQWGAVTRKINIADTDPEEDAGYKWPVGYDSGHGGNENGDGQSVDMYALKKPKVVQTNFYGFLVWQDHYSIFRDQLKNAFRGPAEFSQFWAMVQTWFDNKHETYYDAFKRMCLGNFAAAIADEAQGPRNVKLLTEYNTLTGQELTATTVYAPDNYVPFMRYVYGRVAAICDMLTNRTEQYQTVIGDNHVMRHTPYSDQRIYMLAQDRYSLEAQVLADTYHDNYLRFGDVESLSYWQSPDNPAGIQMTPVYTDSTGAVKTGEEQTLNNVFAVIADRNAFGVAELERDVNPTPFNARGRYTNIWFHSKMRAFNDLTEKGLVLTIS